MHLASLFACAAGLLAVALADLPFDCHVEAFDAWTSPKKQWCCGRIRPNGWLPAACPSDRPVPLRQAQDASAWPPPPAGAAVAPGALQTAAPRVQLDTGTIGDVDSKPVHIEDDVKRVHTEVAAEDAAPHVLVAPPEPASAADGGDPLWVTAVLVVAVLLAGSFLAWLSMLARREFLLGRSAVTLPHEQSAWYAWNPFSDDAKRVAVF